MKTISLLLFGLSLIYTHWLVYWTTKEINKNDIWYWKKMSEIEKKHREKNVKIYKTAYESTLEENRKLRKKINNQKKKIKKLKRR